MPDQLLKVGQVAAMLNATVGSVYRLVAARRIPHLKVRGAGVRFDPAKIQRWLDGQEIGRGGGSK